MNKRTLVLIAALLPVLLAARPTAAIDWDWGGSLDNATAFSVPLRPTSHRAFEQKDKLAVWVDMQLNPKLTLSTQGSYTFTLDKYYLFDLDYLKAEAVFRPNLRGVFGRFAFEEFTGHILNHTLDGFYFRWDQPKMELVGSVGFSGLLLKPASKIIMSSTDGADQGSDEVFFAAPRLIETLTAVFPQLFARQDLRIALILQEDLRPSDQVIQQGETDPHPPGLSGGRLHSFYLGAGLNGPIMPSLYYDSFVYFETGSTLSWIADPALPPDSYQYKPIVAFLGGFGVRYYLEHFLASRLELRGIFSSGDGDNSSFLEGNTAGNSLLFVPISQETIGLAFQPQLGNLILVEASYSLKPLTNLQALLKTLFFLRPTAGSISVPGLYPASDARYLGAELDGVLNYRPWSDLGLSLSLGVFLPNPGAFDSQYPRFTGQFEFSFGF
jgi:hypothetical protein